jgi:hypothetical protein
VVFGTVKVKASVKLYRPAGATTVFGAL